VTQKIDAEGALGRIQNKSQEAAKQKKDQHAEVTGLGGF
jgi:hypothetical protein